MRIQLHGRVRRIGRTVRPFVRGRRKALVLVLGDVVVHVAQKLDRLGQGGWFGGVGAFDRRPGHQLAGEYLVVRRLDVACLVCLLLRLLVLARATVILDDHARRHRIVRAVVFVRFVTAGRQQEQCILTRPDRAGSSLMRRRLELEPESDFCDSPNSPLMLYDWDATFSTCCGDFIDSWSACIC
uniref:Uncharacterized protein n=1 Tax=Anopheles maculatus TaxID=74869 RepID=A0A182T1Z1_9DIPT